MNTSFIKKASLAGFILLGIFGAISATRIVHTNGSSTYQVKQAAITGELSIRTEPGLYLQNFGTIESYSFSDDFDFQIPNVLFRDGSSATISGTVRLDLPATEEERILIHRELRSYYGMKKGVVKNAVVGALAQTAKLFGAEEVYSTESAKFIELFRAQLNEGIYKTVRSGQTNTVARDKDGKGLIAKPSILAAYGVYVPNIEIATLDFDKKTDELIASRKDAEQQETLARAEAVRAKQDAITAEARGKATVAKVKYEALAISEKAVIDAQKNTAIEEEKTLQALEYAKQIEASKKAEAAGNMALVAAGLSPLEEANIQKETDIGVAQAISRMQWPQIMIFGGEGSAQDPMSAINLRMLQSVANEIHTPKPATK